MSFPALTEAQNRLQAKQDELHKVLKEAGPELDMDKIKSIPGSSADKVDWIRKANEELDEIGEEVDGFLAVKAAHDRTSRRDADAEAKARREHGSESGTKGGDGAALAGDIPDLGDLFTKSDAFLKRSGGQGPMSHLDLGADGVKTLFERSTGWTPESIRTGKLVDKVTTPIQVIDWIPGTTTSQAAVVYMEETTYTNTAAETAEGGTYNEAALGVTERSVTVQKFTVSLPMTDEQLEDVAYARGYVNNRLPRMLRQRLDSQIINGNGTAPNIRGILNTTGIQTQARTAGGNVPDAIYRAMVKVRVTGGAMPNVTFWNPLDWQEVRLLRTENGEYLWGSPTEEGSGRIWGLPAVEVQVLPQGDALVLDTTFTEFATRRGIDMQLTNSHGTDFLSGVQRVRADFRGAFIVYRPSAIVSVDLAPVSSGG